MKLALGALSLRKLDPLITLALLPLLVMGLLFISSGEGRSQAARQMMWMAVGIGVFFAAASYDYLKLIRLAPFLYGGTLLSLIVLLALPPMVSGNIARSWFRLGGLSFQPSEMMKVFVVLMMANYLMYRDNYRKFLGLLIPLGMALVPMLLVFKQPDLGSAVIFIPVAFAVLYVAAARFKHLVMVTVLGILTSVYAWFYYLSQYQKIRIEAWRHPERFLDKESYQLLQSLTSIGSGGFTGKGLGEGITCKIVPENHTDFIFAVISEEWGFIGASLMLACFLAIIVAGLGIALRTREPAGRLLAVGIVALFASEVVINLYVAMGIFPTTGIALPFISYGGSSMVSSFLALGILVNVGAKQHPVFADDDFR